MNGFYRRSLQPPKREHPVFQNMKFFTFSLHLWFILGLLDPDPDPHAQLNRVTIGIRIRIRNIGYKSPKINYHKIPDKDLTVSLHLSALKSLMNSPLLVEGI